MNFLTEDDRNTFATKVIRQRKKECHNLKYFGTLDSKKILSKRALTENWAQWKISNFEYLMQLNYLAGRSFNDLS